MGTFDLVIIAVPIQQLASATLDVIGQGHLNVLVEKPGSFHADDLERLAQKAEETGSRVRIAYNRLLYPSYWKMKELIGEDGGITSCRYTFTEVLKFIDFDKFQQDTYEHWGKVNPLHVISMVHGLIGMPKDFFDYRAGSLSWHPSGARFAGAGVTDKDIMFSYHADWESAGRWGIEIMTPKYSYRMVPLEGLFCCKKDTFAWEPMPFEVPFPDVKEGVAEEVAIMLDPSFEEALPLVSLCQARDYIKLADRIFGY
jgi:predicted dehydrogenase